MKKLMILALLIVAALVGYHFFNVKMKSQQMPAGGGAMPVSVGVVEQKDIVETQVFSGRLQAVNDAEIRPQVGGTIEKIYFKEGDMVKAGAPLFALDSRTYRAAVMQTEASFTEAKMAMERGKLLFAEEAISKADMETRAANYQRAQAALTDARVNLDYSTIKAPIDGKIGRADVTVGNVVAANMANALTTIQSISPIYVDFDIDEQTYLEFVNMKKSKDADAAKVNVGLADNGDDYPLAGTLQSTDNRLDPTTGSLRARAVLPNEDGSLLPGLFARVQVSAPNPTNAVLVNDAAVGTDQSKRFVYVVGSDNKAVYREVKLAGMAEGLRVIKTGLQGGERVVVNGLMRVQPGATVAPTVVDMVTLSSSTTPATTSAATPAATSSTTPDTASPTKVSGTAAVSGTAE